MTGQPDSQTLSAPAKEEALKLAEQALELCSTPGHDTLGVLRLGYRISELLQWPTAKDWFWRELQGYPADVDPPWYRKGVQGSLEWRVPELPQETAIHVGHFGIGVPQNSAVAIQDLHHGVGWLAASAIDGYQERTGATSVHSAPAPLDRMYTIYQTRNFPAVAFRRVLALIEDEAFRWLSNVQASLRYGGTLGDAWGLYTRVVDEKLPQLGLAPHYLTIDVGLRSSNPQDWRAALWSCRDLLHDLAGYLWRDPNPTYKHLPGKGKDGGLDVTESHYVNRIGAYLHQKLGGSTTREYLATEADRIYASIDKLSDFASKAHSGAPAYEDLRTAALSTYFLVGELVLRTDMVPVEVASDVTVPKPSV
jgi:hypothetical protein